VLATKIVPPRTSRIPEPGAILQGIQNNEWDVTFWWPILLAWAEADFHPYMQTDYTYFGSGRLFKNIRSLTSTNLVFG